MLWQGLRFWYDNFGLGPSPGHTPCQNRYKNNRINCLNLYCHRLYQLWIWKICTKYMYKTCKSYQAVHWEQSDLSLYNKLWYFCQNFTSIKLGLFNHNMTNLSLTSLNFCGQMNTAVEILFCLMFRLFTFSKPFIKHNNNRLYLYLQQFHDQFIFVFVFTFYDLFIFIVRVNHSRYKSVGCYKLFKVLYIAAKNIWTSS